MQMDELFYRDPYVREFDAQVLSCDAVKDGYEVVLSDTAFYPEGGGQPADHGLIDDAIVSHVARRKDGSIAHKVNREFEIGVAVHGKLDWQRRFDNMQNHSGEHLLSGIVHRLYGFDNVGFHMDEDVIVCDFDGEISEEQMVEVERLSNEGIIAGEPVDILFPSAEELETMGFRSKKELSGRVRIVSVGQFDTCACCGTHVARTSEIGSIKILSVMRHRGGTRVEFVCGNRALRNHERCLRENGAISRLLSAKPGTLAEAVKKTLDDLMLRDQRIQEMAMRYFAMRTASLPKDEPALFLCEEGLSPLDMKNFASVLMQEARPGICALVSVQSNGALGFVLRSESKDMRVLSKALNARLNGRGGGSAQGAQGMWNADSQLARDVFIEEVAKLA